MFVHYGWKLNNKIVRTLSWPRICQETSKNVHSSKQSLLGRSLPSTVHPLPTTTTTFQCENNDGLKTKQNCICGFDVSFYLLEIGDVPPQEADRVGQMQRT